MTLKEQIRPHSQYWDCYNDEPLEYDHTNKLLKIADNYAIEFAEWKDKISTQDLIYSSKFAKTNKELLEIYKKEKGL